MTKLKSKNHTNWNSEREFVSQPTGINYSQLFEKLANNSNEVKDFRKNMTVHSSDSKDEVIQNIHQESIIPVPGLMIEHENSESDWQPSSEWQTSKGLNWGA